MFLPVSNRFIYVSNLSIFNWGSGEVFFNFCVVNLLYSTPEFKYNYCCSNTFTFNLAKSEHEFFYGVSHILIYYLLWCEEDAGEEASK